MGVNPNDRRARKPGGHEGKCEGKIMVRLGSLELPDMP